MEYGGGSGLNREKKGVGIEIWCAVEGSRFAVWIGVGVLLLGRE